MGNEYIVVVFQNDGIGYTLQTDDRCYWAFSHHAKIYKRFGMAKKAVSRMKSKYSYKRIVVYDITDVKSISCSFFKDWEDKIVFEISKIG